MAENTTKTNTARVLVVDDDRDMIALLSLWLKQAGLAVDTAASGSEALTRVALHRPHLVVTDLFMENMDGIKLLTEIHRQNPLLPVIMLSGQAGIPDAVRATHLGITAFLTKPVAREEFISQVQQALRRTGISKDTQHEDFANSIIYRSAAMAEVVDQARMVAEADITVFISGETGTGKEVLAKAIHQGSPRRNMPFIGVNCGAIPEQLLESELFGHEKGAFTGAAQRHEGLFQAANGGTLFLDEIGDMPLGLQVKLLRVLQDFEVRPVGSVKSIPINVRIISATHSNLEEAVNAGEFREDLYYRLNVVPLRMPSLAERPEDISLLVNHFLDQVAARRHVLKKHFAPDAMEYLATAPWPGNVRQLANVVELCATLTKTDIIPLSMAKKALRDEPGQLQTLRDAKNNFERKYLISVLRVTSGRVADAARIAGRNRTEFYKLLEQHNLDPVEFRGKRQRSKTESEEDEFAEN
jgi:two-component system, NtrC family, response regulator GlrR